MEKFPSAERSDKRNILEKIDDSLTVSEYKIRAQLRGFFRRFERKLNLINSISWQANGFDTAETLRERTGPLIEIGGPTLQGFDLVPPDAIKNSQKQYLTSNITNGMFSYDKIGDRERALRVSPVDFVADGRHLPLRDSSVGALFASCLNSDIREEVIIEAARVIEPGGILVWQGAMLTDYAVAHKAGLDLKCYEWELPLSITSEIAADTVLTDIQTLNKEVIRIAHDKEPNWLIISGHDGDSLPDSVWKSRHVEYSDSLVPYCCIFQKPTL